MLLWEQCSKVGVTNSENGMKIILSDKTVTNLSGMESTFHPHIKTVPGQIQLACADKEPYVAGQNKQQYPRGRQTKPYTVDHHNTST